MIAIRFIPPSSQSEVPRLDLLVPPERVRRARVHDPPPGQDVYMVGDPERQREVLFDEQDR
jgi:hypothetical protein